jgi:hypothetical protein
LATRARNEPDDRGDDLGNPDRSQGKREDGHDNEAADRSEHDPDNRADEVVVRRNPSGTKDPYCKLVGEAAQANPAKEPKDLVEQQHTDEMRQKRNP